MGKIISITALIILLVLVLSSCTVQPGVVSPPPPTSASSDPTAVGQKVITLADQGSTIYLSVGESFLLQLGEEYIWDVSVSDQNVVSRVRNITVVRGAQGVYNALQAGTVTLSATGDPVCRQSNPPCAMPSILFEIKIVVK